MEALYTSRYKINLIFSLFISLTVALLTGTVLPYVIGDYLYSQANISALIATAIFFTLHLFLTRKYRKRKKILLLPFPNDWETILEEDILFYKELSKEDKISFQRRVQIFLGEKFITGINVEIDDRTRILIASAAVIPVFKITDWEYDKLTEILVYPDNFNGDYDYGSSHNILGMVIHNTSSMIISKKALYEGFSKQDGNNTAIHEFIHKIDEEDGEIDGLPALMLNRDELFKWREIIRSEVKKIASGKSDINKYALRNDAEFFAVASEYFFEKPEQMRDKHYELYLIMNKIFKQDKATLIKKEIKKLLPVKRQEQRKDFFSYKNR